MRVTRSELILSSGRPSDTLIPDCVYGICGSFSSGVSGQRLSDNHWLLYLAMDALTCEYLSGNCLTKIIPFIKHDPIELISGTTPRLEPNRPVDVPAWWARQLNRERKCRLIPPDWLGEQILTDIKTNEKSQPTFTRLPHEYFFELADMMLSDIRADEAGPGGMEKQRTLVKDIYDVRRAKLRNSISQLVGSGVTHVAVTNLTTFEIAACRDFLAGTMSQMHMMRS